MGMHNRSYWREGDYEVDRAEGMSFGMPRPGRAVGSLLAINFTVYLLQIFLNNGTVQHPYGYLTSWLGLSVGDFWQVWRYVTFQFLHGGVWHLLLNMLGLYMLGSPLEQHWGGRRFLKFYLLCGATAGLAYVALGSLASLPHDLPIIGASGGVYAVLLTCAILFPAFRIVFILFLVPIRLAAVIIFAGMTLMTLSAFVAGSGVNAMSDVAHLGGAAAAAVWIWLIPRLRLARLNRAGALNQGGWLRRMYREKIEQEEVDRILDKIHTDGITSLTSKERHILKEATQRQQEEDRRLRRL